jgi:DNA repair exonuclease SbcCD ATPase subunit
MSPTERLEFLEHFAFNNIDITEIKEKAKKMIKETSISHSKTLGNLEFSDKLIKESKKPEEVLFPIKCSEENREKAIKNEEIKLKNSQIITKRLEKEIKNIEEKINNFNIFNTMLKEKEINLSKIKQKILNLDEELKNSSETFIGKEKLDILKKDLNFIVSQKEFITLKTKFEENEQKLSEMKQKEFEEREEKIVKIKSDLWTSLTKSEIDEQISFWEHLVNLQKNLQKLKKNYIIIDDDPSERLEKVKFEINSLTIKLKLQQQAYTCPHCSKKVRLDSSVLKKYEDDYVDLDYIKNQIESLKKEEKILSPKLQKFLEMKDTKQKIFLIEKEISENLNHDDVIDNFDKELEDWVNYKRDNFNREKVLEKLELEKVNNIFSSSIQIIEKTNKDMKKKIDSFNFDYKTVITITEEEIRNLINLHSLILNNIQKTKQNIEVLEEEKRTEEKVINEILSDEKITNINLETLVKDIAQKTEEIKLNEEKRDKSTEILKKIEKFKEYEKELLNYEKLFKDKKELEGREIKDRKRYASACLFRDKIQEAESVAIGNIIDNINTHAQMYLDTFFPDNPISVKISAFKETKSTKETKPSINLVIDYKGMEHDITMLSGGELSRVVLAFTLALAEIHNSPLILLDECTSSLDQELTGSVIEGLKENFNDKLVVLIAHQVVQGVFDKIIKL